MKPRHLLVSILLPVLLALSARADEAEVWIAKARSFLGEEKVLNAVKSIHFKGTLDTIERVPSDTDKNVTVNRPVSVPVEIIFEKPFRQKITVWGPKFIESTALDGYDAWQKVSSAANPAQWEVRLLGPSQVKRLRANTLENLAFYSTKEMPGCTAHVAGDVVVDEVDCVKVTFTHVGGVVFSRYFERTSGRLIKTDTENGSELREEGEMRVNGIRFPRRVVSKSPEGILTAITFDRITVNETLPADTFAVPLLHSK